MTSDLKPHHTRYLRLRSQNLFLREKVRPAPLVRRLVGVQAQEPAAAALALRARSRGLVARDVDRAREGSRELVRTWSLRGTLHLHAAADLNWLLPLLGPVFIRRSRRRFAELGLSEAIYDRVRVALESSLEAAGPLTRAELAARLAERGIPTEGQAAYHLVRRAGLEGRLCYGPDRAGEPTYVSLRDWGAAGPKLDPEAALARLARRYLAAYGPARPEDFAAWSGLSLASARAGFEGLAGETQAVGWDGVVAYMLREGPPGLVDGSLSETHVRLLPGYDPYLLGYRRRDLVVAQEYARRIHPGGGVIRPTLLVGGRAAGVWRLKRRTNDLVVRIQSFAALDPATLPALEAEVQDLGRFLETAAVLDLEKPEE